MESTEKILPGLIEMVGGVGRSVCSIFSVLVVSCVTLISSFSVLVWLLLRLSRAAKANLLLGARVSVWCHFLMTL